MLVLDNVEQLVNAPGPTDVLVDLLERLPDLTLVLTSRFALRLSDEQLAAARARWALPDLDESDPEQVRASESVQLFLDRARAAAPDFAVTAGQRRGRGRALPDARRPAAGAGAGRRAHPGAAAAGHGAADRPAARSC